MRPSRTGTVALAIRIVGEAPKLIDQFSDETEISLFEEAIAAGESDPLAKIYHFRQRQREEEEEFGDYVEELLSKPFLRPEVQEHGLQWLKSKMRIEDYIKKESAATQVIAEYALKLLRDDPKRRDFTLAGQESQVKVKVYLLGEAAQSKAS